MESPAYMSIVMVMNHTKRYSPSALGICSGAAAYASMTPKPGINTAA